jgi:hypothetical protein
VGDAQRAGRGDRAAGDRRARHERGKANLEPMVEKLSSLILSPRDIAAAQARAEFVERTAPAEVGTERFREKFTVLARNNRLARALFDVKTEASLAKWPGGGAEDRISIWLDWQGLRIDVSRRTRDGRDRAPGRVRSRSRRSTGGMRFARRDRLRGRTCSRAPGKGRRSQRAETERTPQRPRRPCVPVL